jgi:hypothetical protein
MIAASVQKAARSGRMRAQPAVQFPRDVQGVPADVTKPNLDTVMAAFEHPRPDHHEHAETPRHLDESELGRGTQHESDEIARGQQGARRG